MVCVCSQTARKWHHLLPIPHSLAGWLRVGGSGGMRVLCTLWVALCMCEFVCWNRFVGLRLLPTHLLRKSRSTSSRHPATWPFPFLFPGRSWLPPSAPRWPIVLVWSASLLLGCVYWSDFSMPPVDVWCRMSFHVDFPAQYINTQRWNAVGPAHGYLLLLRNENCLECLRTMSHGTLSRKK